MALTLQLGTWQPVALGPHRTLLRFAEHGGPHWLSVHGAGEVLLEPTADDRSPPDRPYEVRVRRGMGEVLQLGDEPTEVRVRRGECCLSAPREVTVQVRVAGAPGASDPPPSFAARELVGAVVTTEGMAPRVVVASSQWADSEDEEDVPTPVEARAAPTLPPEPAPAPKRRSLPADEPPQEFELLGEPEPTPPPPAPEPTPEPPKKGFFGRRKS